MSEREKKYNFKKYTGGKNMSEREKKKEKKENERFEPVTLKLESKNKRIFFG